MRHTPSQGDEIRCKYRYNGAFCCAQITQCQLCRRPVGSVSSTSRAVCLCVNVLVRACMSRSNQVISQTHLPSGCPAACLFICSPFWLLTTYLMSPLHESCRLICPSLSAAAAALRYNMGGEIRLHTDSQTNTFTLFSHTQGDSYGWNYCSCVAPNGLLKWLIKGKQLLCRRTDGASPPTEAGTSASQENTVRGVSDSAIRHYCYWN